MGEPKRSKPMSGISRIHAEAAVRAEVERHAVEFERQYGPRSRGGLDQRNTDYRRFANTYYDLVTDFYEYGWGKSFHFAPRAPGEAFAASLARHEHYLAHVLGLRPGQRVMDLGCGVGGPLREIARFSGATIVGLNNNAYQVERARRMTEEEELGHLAEYMLGDFMEVDVADESFDAAYMIEASCHSPDRKSLYSEVYRLLKPRAAFASYEWCMTDRFNPQDSRHANLKIDLQIGSGVHEIVRTDEVDRALVEVGFEIIETRDLACSGGLAFPWYEPLAGSGWSCTNFRSSTAGRRLTYSMLTLLETVRVVPQGSAQVAKLLNGAAAGLAKAGRLGIFTPMYMVHVRKPA